MSIADRIRDNATGAEADLALTMEHFGAHTGTIHVLGGDGQLHLIAWAGGIPKHLLPVIETIPVGKGIAGLTVERNEPVNMCNLQTDESGQARPGAKAIAAKGSVCVPIRRDGKPVGALGVAVAEEREFSDAEVGELLSVAEVLAGRL